MILLDTSLGGMNAIFKNVKASKCESVNIISLFEFLKYDSIDQLQCLDTKKIRGTKNSLFEIREGSIRLFYIIKDNNIVILHVCRKQKNKTEKKDKNLADKRATKYQ